MSNQLPPNKRKSDLKNRAASSTTQEPMVMVPLSFMASQEHGGGRFLQGPNGGSVFVQPSASATAKNTQASSSGSRRKAWLKVPEEEDNEDDDEAFEMDDDFIPPKKRRSSLPSKLNSTQKKKEFSSAQAHITFQKVKRLPEKFMGRPIISTDGRKDCVSCGIYLGEIMFLPCGHARFCTKCANKVHDRAHALKRLVLCPVDSCYSSIEGWIRLRNCMV